MRTFDTDTATALQQRQLRPRNFIWITAPRISDRVVQSAGFWNDRETITANYIDVDDGTTKSRPYIGAGSLISLDNIPFVSDASIRTINAKMSHLQADAVDYFRGFDLHMAPIEIHRGLFKYGTYQLVAPAYPRFVGFIDKSVFRDPTQGGDGEITISITSHTRLLTRVNPETRSDASQKARNSFDNFYQDTPTCGDWTIFWGQTKGAIGQVNPQLSPILQQALRSTQ